MSEAIEKERLDIERQRLKVEEARAAFEKRLSNRYLAVIIGALVSSAGLTLSYCQTNTERAQKERETNIMDVRQTNEWNLSALKFVTEHAEVIYGPDNDKRTRIRDIMVATFPPNITTKLFQNLEATATSDQAKTTWNYKSTTDKQDQVMVWANTGSGVYHCPGSEWYQNTAHGSLMTQKQALSSGYRPARDSPCQ